MKSKCSVSPDGKHKWKHWTTTDKFLGTKTQFRKCKLDGYKEKLVRDVWGHKRWEPV